MMLKKIILFASVLALMACGDNSADKDAKYIGAKTVKVETLVLKKSTIPVYRSFSGTASSNKTALLVPKAVGYIEMFKFSPGESFKKGDTLLVIKSQELEDKLKFTENSVKEAENALLQSEIGLRMANSQRVQAESQFSLAEKTYQRFKNLLESSSVSQQEFDQVESKYKAALESKTIAEDNVKLAEQKINQVKIKKQQALSGLAEVTTYLSYTRMKAPYDGVLLEKMMDAGNLASPGQPIAKIGSQQSAIYTYFNEKVLPYVKKGDPIKVEVSSLGLTYTSQVLEVSPNIDPATRNFKVKLAGHPQIVAGMYAKVWLEKGDDSVLMIPASAVVKRGQLTFVFVNNNSVAEMRFVKVGKRIGKMIEIRSGLNEGDVIVVKDALGLEAGDHLED